MPILACLISLLLAYCLVGLLGEPAANTAYRARTERSTTHTMNVMQSAAKHLARCTN